MLLSTVSFPELSSVIRISSAAGGVALGTMTRDSMPAILLQLQTADSLPSQLSILRALKNETIGHGQRKEAWVRWGIVPLLRQILTQHTATTTTNVAPPALNGAGASRPKSDEDQACLQAIIVLGSLAQGTSERCRNTSILCK